MQQKHYQDLRDDFELIASVDSGTPYETRTKIFQDFSDVVYTLHNSGIINVLQRDLQIQRSLALLKARGHDSIAQELEDILKDEGTKIFENIQEKLLTFYLGTSGVRLTEDELLRRFSDALGNPLLTDIKQTYIDGVKSTFKEAKRNMPGKLESYLRRAEQELPKPL